MNCPPKPHLTFRIGVTGHRPGLQLAAESLARAQSQIADIFKSANDALTQAHRQFQASYSSTSPQLRVISSIAEGADRIAAKAALACGLQLEVILPLDRQSYEVDFSTQESRNEFAELLARASAILEISDNSQVSTREQAYAAAGEELLAQCDLLLTVWDGAPGRGQGGTAEVLRTAHRLGIPYVWIHATRDVEPAIIAYPVKGVTRERESWSAQLQSVILGLVLPPGSPEGDSILRRDLARSAAAKSDNYFAENEHNARWALPYDLFGWIFAGRVPRRKSKIRKLSDRASEWKGFLNALPEIGELKRKLNSILLERYVWADHLATHYANIYRSTYVTIFGLAGLAVCVGLLSSFEDRDEITKAALIGFEVGLISIIVWLIHRGRGRAWHARWLDYRQIAEALRHARFLALTGRLTYGYSEEGVKTKLLISGLHGMCVRVYENLDYLAAERIKSTSRPSFELQSCTKLIPKLHFIWRMRVNLQYSVIHLKVSALFCS